MPIVPLLRDQLFVALGREDMTQDEFEELCFEFGVELDDVTSEKLMARKERGDGEASEGLSDEVIYKIDVPANRYDILCLEGLQRALLVFQQTLRPPVCRLLPEAPAIRMVVKPATAKIRPFVVCAVLRNLTLDHQSYNNLLDLQDKLHQNVCRNRTLVAIGTHDLDTLSAPFVYDARAPETIKFRALLRNKEEEAVPNARELLDFYRNDVSAKHIKPYTDIIYDSPVYPVIYDAGDAEREPTVLSLPPIINGDHSKMSPHTKNVFIECTATDLNKASIVLNQIVCLFSEYCDDKYTVEPVEVVYVDEAGETIRTDVTPHLEMKQLEVRVAEINSTIGVSLAPGEIAELLTKMQLSATVNPGGETLNVQIPPLRSDILHECDVIEDVAIAYGYNNLVAEAPKVATCGRELPINKLCDKIRHEVIAAGYTETLTLTLCSKADAFDRVNRVDDGKTAVELSNPTTREFEIVRPSLLPGLLKTIQCNRSMSFLKGFKLFEVSDVVLQDPLSDVGARNFRNIAALYVGRTSGFEHIHGLVDRIMELLSVSTHASYGITDDSPTGDSAAPGELQYFISNHREGDKMYFPGRAADITLMRPGGPTVVGTFGVLHPSVLKNFDIPCPCSVLEMEMEPFL